MNESKWIHFKELKPNPKTKVFEVLEISTDYSLGKIKWFSPWRQYCFFPQKFCIFSKGCMEDINNFIKKLMDERK